MADNIRRIHHQYSRPRTDAEKEMEILSSIATSYYRAASPEVQAKAKQFFESMDADGDKRVVLEEFLKFVREMGYTEMHNNQFFKMLDTNRNGCLGFREVMTLYYIIKSGRPFCRCCADFIPGIYFSCVDCFNDAKTFYTICYTCYRSDKRRHGHNGASALFLDNYTLLRAQRENRRSERRQSLTISTTSDTRGTCSSSVTNYMKNELNRVLSDSTAIVPCRTSIFPNYADSHGTSLRQQYVAHGTTLRRQYADSHVKSIFQKEKYADSHSLNRSAESSSQALVPASAKMAANAFRVLEGVITIVNFSATFCTIL